MLDYNAKGYLREEKYSLNNDAKHATLFTTGNGYMGIRGSYEEFGSSRVQGAYVRGLIDEIVEVMEPFPDNIYMKKYYFDEQKLKDFEKQDSCINFADIVLVRFCIGERTFYPWEGKILHWNRFLDTKKAMLFREVTWQDEDGNITKFSFERFASYADEHLYVMRCIATPVNHNKKITVLSGIDKKVRTGGQRIIQEEKQEITDRQIVYSLKAGEKYGFRTGIAVCTDFITEPDVSEPYDQDGIIANRGTWNHPSASVGVCKKIYINISRDHDRDVYEQAQNKIGAYKGTTFEELLKSHLNVWEPLFKKFDIKIEGDKDADASLRFSTYHTIISAAMNDSVHGLPAKSLSGERYNQFVWWDAEIYQVPVFTFADPAIAKNSLMFRYSQLNDARKNAKKEGLKGARYPFVSSVGGQERVWSYARHPHLQVHITADVGYSVVFYFRMTRDEKFLFDYGYEMLSEIMRYWVSRATVQDGKFVILNVTGTDEHHPYVDIDAYTNYLVKFIFDAAIKFYDIYPQLKKYFSDTEMEEMRSFAERLYLPMDANGLIPQFDGYFSLSRSLQIEGSGTGKNFQMKQAGLYHLSQVIKQPDVMLLYSYINYPFTKDKYAENWDYYETMCEASSSLSYPVHAICSADNRRMLSFRKYFMETVRMDIDDVHHCAWQGIHAGCAAGGYIAVLRGIFGVKLVDGELVFIPSPVPFWEKVSMRFMYRGVSIKCSLTNTQLVIDIGENTLKIKVNGKEQILNKKKIFIVEK